jgi:hypothetical protein
MHLFVQHTRRSVGTHYVVVCCGEPTVLEVRKMDESAIKYFMREQ